MLPGWMRLCREALRTKETWLNWLSSPGQRAAVEAASTWRAQQGGQKGCWATHLQAHWPSSIPAVTSRVDAGFVYSELYLAPTQCKIQNDIGAGWCATLRGLPTRFISAWLPCA